MNPGACRKFQYQPALSQLGLAEEDLYSILSSELGIDWNGDQEFDQLPDKGQQLIEELAIVSANTKHLGEDRKSIGEALVPDSGSQEDIKLNQDLRDAAQQVPHGVKQSILEVRQILG